MALNSCIDTTLTMAIIRHLTIDSLYTSTVTVQHVTIIVKGRPQHPADQYSDVLHVVATAWPSKMLSIQQVYV